MQFSNTIVIRRPVSEVFAYLAAFGNIPEWNHAIEASSQSPGPTRVGTIIHQTRSLPSRSAETLRVTEFVQDRVIALDGSLGPFDGVMRYELEATPEGTRLTNSADLRAGGLLGLAAPLAAGRVSGAVAQNLSVLKRILESA